MKYLLLIFVKYPLYLISLLPLRILYLFSDFLYFVLFHIVKYRRHVTLKNLTNSFPEKSIQELKSIEKEYYKYLCDLIVEGVKMFTISQKELIKRFRPVNVHIVNEQIEKGRSCLVYTSHYGNWEWACLAGNYQSKYPAFVVYKKQSSRYFESLLNTARSRFGVEMVEMNSVPRMIPLLEKTASTMCFASDQVPLANNQRLFIDFLHQDTPVFTGVEKIAIKKNFPVFYLHFRRVKRGYYESELYLISDQPKYAEPNELTIKYNTFLEKVIQDNPPYWLWSHKRWKYTSKDVGK